MSLAENISKANILVEALPYIKRFAGKTIVVKYGGSLLSNRAVIDSLARDIALLRYVGMKPVIVHGGGQEIQRWLKKLGKEPKVVDGQPFTDAETLEIIDMVLTGHVSNFIVSSLTRCGVKALGLSGRDAQIFTTRRIKTDKQKDLGFVGEVESTDVSLLHKLADDNYVPVLSSVGLSRDGTILNVESDHVAASIASSLKAVKLIYLTSSEGLLKGRSLLEEIDLPEAEQLLKTEEMKPGMQLKLRATIQALKGGVSNIHIINGNVEHAVLLEVFTDKGIGSMISNEKMRV